MMSVSYSRESAQSGNSQRNTHTREWQIRYVAQTTSSGSRTSSALKFEESDFTFFCQLKNSCWKYCRKGVVRSCSIVLKHCWRLSMRCLDSGLIVSWRLIAAIYSLSRFEV